MALSGLYARLCHAFIVLKTLVLDFSLRIKSKAKLLILNYGLKL